MGGEGQHLARFQSGRFRSVTESVTPCIQLVHKFKHGRPKVCGQFTEYTVTITNCIPIEFIAKSLVITPTGGFEACQVCGVMITMMISTARYNQQSTPLDISVDGYFVR